MKIAKAKAQRNCFFVLYFVQHWCGPLQSDLLWSLQPQRPKKQQHMSPGPPAKPEIHQGLTTLKLLVSSLPQGRSPSREGTTRGACTAPDQAFLTRIAKEHFHIYQPTHPSGWPIKPKERWNIRNRMHVIPALNERLSRWCQACERGRQRTSCSPKPISISHGDGTQQVCLGGTLVQPLYPAAWCCDVGSQEIRWI